MNIDKIHNYVNTVLYLILAYSVYILYLYSDKLTAVLRERRKYPDFFVSILLFLLIIILYLYLKYQFLQIDSNNLSNMNKDKYKKIKKKIHIFKQAILSGISAIIIGIFSLSGSLMPSFFLTLLANYHTSQLF